MAPSNPSGDVKSADLDLVGRIRSGDGAAFEALYRQHATRLYNLASRMMGRHGEADDLLQDIFLLAYRKIGSFRGESSLGTWLYRLAMNHCLDVLRNRQTRMGQQTDSLDEPDAPPVVSPVPLVATAEPGAHVLAATTYSKSVLRVAAETVRQRFASVHYFPSFEIITGAFNRGAYFAGDLRNVVEEGVSHVMRLFMHHATGNDAGQPLAKSNEGAQNTYLDAAHRLVDVECDEIHLDAR